MDNIQVDAELAAKLAELANRVPVVGEAGECLGYFVPVGEYALHAHAAPPVSDDELARRSAAPGGRSLAEIMSDLQRKSS